MFDEEQQQSRCQFGGGGINGLCKRRSEPQLQYKQTERTSGHTMMAGVLSSINDDRSSNVVMLRGMGFHRSIVNKMEAKLKTSLWPATPWPL